MSYISDTNKRIALNTAFLYFRMLLIMGVTLYTSRVVLKVLGVTDYGIYNVVGGVVTMLAFFNSSLSTATQRYLNYEMGRGDKLKLQQIFSMSFIGFCIIAILTFLLAETVGLWFICNKLIIPVDRTEAAITVYHFSVMTFVVSILMIPYNAAIIAHEKMSIYAYISIAEVLLKLSLVFVLQLIEYDKLIIYGFMMFLVMCIVASFYRLYCIRLFQECRLRWIWNKDILKKLFSFSGWMLSGTITNMLSTQGVNMLINMFFGPTMNAARAVAVQVNSAVHAFSTNFMTAVRPQVVKSYAQGNLEYMYKLVFSSSKFSFFMLFFLTIPILCSTDFILSLWLDIVPSYAVIFTQLVLIDLLINSSYSPLAYVSQATGKVRDYQLVISLGFVLIAILVYVAFRLHYPVEFAFYIAIFVDILGLFLRLLVLVRVVKFPILKYLKYVMLPIIIVSITTILILYFVKQFFNVVSLLDFIVLSIFCVLVSACSIYMLGFNQYEKDLVRNGLNKILKH